MPTTRDLFFPLTEQEERDVSLTSKVETILGGVTPISVTLAVLANRAARLICVGPEDLQDPALQFFLEKLKQYQAEARGEAPGLDGKVEPLKDL
jgi:hypothetical protein